MKKYTIAVRETLLKEVEVEAESYNKALREVYELYNNGEILIDEDDFDFVTFDFVYDYEIKDTYSK